MQLSDCLAITPAGLFVYKGDDGKLHEVIGFSKGFFNLRALN